MKGYAIALAILLLLVAAVAWNAAYVRGAAESLLEELRALPCAPVPDQTAPAIRAIRGGFERRTTFLGVTVPDSVLDRIRESLHLLELYAESGDALQYAATLTLLRGQAEAMGRPEKLSVDNLF